MLLYLRRISRRQTTTYIFSGIIYILLFTTFYGSPLSRLHISFASPQFRRTTASHAAYADLLSRQGRFWRSFFPHLEANVPICEPLIHPEDTHLDIFYDATQPQSRPDNLTITRHQLHALHASHQSFVGKIKAEASHWLRQNLPYIKGTRGIATTAGGSYLPVAVISIRMLRKTGSQLPVEVFLAKQDEWDPQICGVLFPTLNARCVVLQDIFRTAGQDSRLKIDKYQYKIMSILFSSFEEVLFMDSDCFPVYDPEPLFLSDPFLSTGLVLWPDFWFPSESSSFFEISGIKEPPVNVRSSTESGEVMYAKPKHGPSLLLATYYNYYGPDFYYPLQSQGAPGEGDKETFYWAAVALDEPVYSVRTMVHALGYHTTKGEWRGSAMVQHDPIVDLATWYSHGSNDISDVNKQNMPGNAVTHSSQVETRPRPYFVHANFPKFDPATIFQDEAMGATGPTRDADGTLRRVWQPTEAAAIEEFGFDLERRLWSEIRSTACEYETDFLAWAGTRDICRNATIYWEALFETKPNFV